jgi:ABC-type transport system involved in multi-copper enzyme maturation permease subunit
MHLMPLLIIARLTLREAIRRRLLHAVAILTVLVIGLTGWGISRLATLHDSSGQPLPHSEVMATTAGLVIMLAYMFSFVLAIGAAFLAAPAIAGDVDSGLVLALLPRPLRRSQFVLGKWLALAALLVTYGGLTSGVELAMVRALTGYLPPHPVQAVAFLAGESVVVLTLALLGSTHLASMTCGIVVLALFGVAWIAGIAESVGVAFHNTAITTAGTVMSLLLPSDGLWRGAVYNLEPAILVAVGGASPRTNPFSVAAPPPTPYIVWAVGWVVVILGLAALSFRRRDL